MEPVDAPPEFPSAVFEALTAYRRTAALKGAIDLDLFTAIGEGNADPEAIAARCRASVRGTRILCDCLVAMGFLAKRGEAFALTPVAARFLDRRSPDYAGTLTRFLNAPAIAAGFDDVAAAVRSGGTTIGEHGTVGPEHPIWVDFAHAMAPMAGLVADALADLLAPTLPEGARILDVAAGHGRFGIALAKRASRGSVVALDWPAVLEVAAQNAAAAGVGARFERRPGDAFATGFGSGYDLVLLPNFLHHFDPAANDPLLRKAHRALAPGGRVVVVDFIPNEDRVSPVPAATFGLVMLALTPGGDVYTFSQYAEMLARAGFSGCALHELPPSQQRAVIARA